MERLDVRQEQDGHSTRGLEGLRIFMVEDEALVAMQLEDMLADIGCQVVGMAMRLDRAAALLDRVDTLDLAILDVNVNGEKVFPLAQSLHDRGVPLLFATGYGRDGLVDGWKAHEVLQKPDTQKQLVEALQTVLDRAASGPADTSNG